MCRKAGERNSPTGSSPHYSPTGSSPHYSTRADAKEVKAAKAPVYAAKDVNVSKDPRGAARAVSKAAAAAASKAENGRYFLTS